MAPDLDLHGAGGQRLCPGRLGLADPLRPGLTGAGLAPRCFLGTKPPASPAGL